VAGELAALPESERVELALAGGDDYERSRALLVGDVNAACEGAFAGGAAEVQDLLRRQAALEQELAACEEAWLTACEEMEALEAAS